MSTPVFDPGAVHLHMRWRDGHAEDIGVRVARPTAAAVLRGRPADEAVRLLPLMYAICGAAQGVAARLALAAARGESHGPAVDAAVLAEAQREHLWRLLLDWPQALGLPRQETLFVAARKCLQDGTLAAWAAAPAMQDHCARIDAALQSLPQPAADRCTLLPALSAAGSVALWPRLSSDFAAAPVYRGAPASTGAVVRQPQAMSRGSLLARVMARAADLVAPAGLGIASGASVAPGIGRAAVETARGMLLHEIVLDGERVADYIIVAPTEWNFHPAGLLQGWLETAPALAEAELKAFAARAVLACDPCVRAEIYIEGGAPA